MKRDLDHLESQLGRHRREAEAFKRDLEAMRASHGSSRSSDAELIRLRHTADEADRVILSLQSVIASLETKLAVSGSVATCVDSFQRRKDRLTAVISSTKHSSGMSPTYLSERKQLTAQIRYLQAKFSRENMFRSSLQVQKQYLLCLVGKLKQT